MTYKNNLFFFCLFFLLAVSSVSAAPKKKYDPTINPNANRSLSYRALAAKPAPNTGPVMYRGFKMAPSEPTPPPIPPRRSVPVPAALPAQPKLQKTRWQNAKKAVVQINRENNYRNIIGQTHSNTAEYEKQLRPIFNENISSAALRELYLRNASNVAIIKRQLDVGRPLEELGIDRIKFQAITQNFERLRAMQQKNLEKRIKDLADKPYKDPKNKQAVLTSLNNELKRVKEDAALTQLVTQGEQGAVLEATSAQQEVTKLVAKRDANRQKWEQNIAPYEQEQRAQKATAPAVR